MPCIFSILIWLNFLYYYTLSLKILLFLNFFLTVCNHFLFFLPHLSTFLSTLYLFRGILVWFWLSVRLQLMLTAWTNLKQLSIWHAGGWLHLSSFCESLASWQLSLGALGVLCPLVAGHCTQCPLFKCSSAQQGLSKEPSLPKRPWSSGTHFFRTFFFSF